MLATSAQSLPAAGVRIALKTVLFREDAARSTKPYKIDKDKNIVFDVKVLGLKSLNGRTYVPEGTKKAVPLYNKKPCNIDHPVDLNQPRSYRDRFGWFNETYWGEDGIYAKEFHYNPKHELTEQFLWDAENNPSACGFSPVHECRLREENGEQFVYEIVAVRHVDLVADAATTSSLFEGRTMPKKYTIKELTKLASVKAEVKARLLEGLKAKVLKEDDQMEEPPAEMSPDEALKAGFKASCMGVFDDDEMDWKSKLSRLKELMAAQEKLLGGSEKAEEGDEEDDEEDDSELEKTEGEDDEEDEEDKAKMKKEMKKCGRDNKATAKNAKLAAEVHAYKVIATYKLPNTTELAEQLADFETDAKREKHAKFLAKNLKTETAAGSGKDRIKAEGAGAGNGTDSKVPKFKTNAERLAYMRSGQTITA